VFIAINVPSEIKRELMKVSAKYPELPAKWEKRDNLHVTAVFVGFATGEELAGVCEAAKEVAERHEVFTLELNKILLMPEDKPRMIWAAGEKSKALYDLKNDLESVLEEKIGFKKENRGLNLHITLARLNSLAWQQIDLEERPDVTEEMQWTFDVNSIEVMESVMEKGGPVFEIIESHQLI
jgi:2'-5' RNA ligase